MAVNGKRKATRTECSHAPIPAPEFPNGPTVFPLRGHRMMSGDTHCGLSFKCRDRGTSQHPTVHRRNPHKHLVQNSRSTRLKNCRVPSTSCPVPWPLTFHSILQQYASHLDHSQQQTQRNNTPCFTSLQPFMGQEDQPAPTCSSPPEALQSPAGPRTPAPSR